MFEETYPDLYREVAERLAAARVEGERLQAECVKRAEEEEAARKAKRKTYEAERLAWIAEHGSPHLKELVELNFPFAQTYRDERRAAELDDSWLSLGSLCGESKPIRDPDPDAISALKTIRERRPEAQLVWVTCYLEDGHNKDDDDCYRDDDEALHLGTAAIEIDFLGESFIKIV